MKRGSTLAGFHVAKQLRPSMRRRAALQRMQAGKQLALGITQERASCSSRSAGSERTPSRLLQRGAVVVIDQPALGANANLGRVDLKITILCQRRRAWP